jgi:succinate dehydrogenase / fumarate reductase membrane anchor subunit
MAVNPHFGAKRLVVGAHYGSFDFLAQRITAVILALYTVVLLIGIFIMPSFTYEHWRTLFTFQLGSQPLGQIMATLAFIALIWHAWIGVRDIWMDYIKPVSVRLGLQVLTILWLLGSLVYFAQIIWRL